MQKTSDDMGKHFFQIFNHNQALRNAIRFLINQIQNIAPLNPEQIEALISTEKAWTNLIQQLGQNAKAIVTEKIQTLNTDANVRYFMLQTIQDIDKNGPFDEADYDLIEEQKPPQRLLVYPAPPTVKATSRGKTRPRRV